MRYGAIRSLIEQAGRAGGKLRCWILGRSATSRRYPARRARARRTRAGASTSPAAARLGLCRRAAPDGAVRDLCDRPRPGPLAARRRQGHRGSSNAREDALIEPSPAGVNVPARWDRLAKAAWEMREQARVHGKTRVGAAVLSEQGNVYGGCNIEHIFRSHDVHAEVNALTTMVASGDGPALALLIAADRERFTPCGAASTGSLSSVARRRSSRFRARRAAQWR